MSEKIPRRTRRPAQGILAHDLNNQLGVILGRCELLTEAMESNSIVAKHVERIQEAARRIVKILDDADLKGSTRIISPGERAGDYLKPDRGNT